jgi:hypothetical protein
LELKFTKNLLRHTQNNPSRLWGIVGHSATQRCSPKISKRTRWKVVKAYSQWKAENFHWKWRTLDGHFTSKTTAMFVPLHQLH